MSLEGASHICLCFWKRQPRKSNNVIVFPFAFHITLQQLLQLVIMNHLEHQLLCASRHYRYCCFWHQKNLYQSSLLLGISFSLVSVLLIFPVWETQLVAVINDIASLALRVTGIHKLLYHGKVEIPFCVCMCVCVRARVHERERL